MSKDTIYREDAIKAINARSDWYQVTCNGKQIAVMLMAKDVNEILEKVPSADRPQGWIPCSERLPSEQGQYLVTFPLCNEEPWVYILSFNKGKFYETDDEWGDVEYDDVTAWMPLPKSWKGADDE